MRSSYGVVPIEVLLGLNSSAESDIANRPSHHDTEEGHDHDDFESFIVDIGPVSSPDELARRAAAVASAHDVLRIKGYAEVAGKPMRLLLQGVGTRMDTRFERPWAAGESRTGRLVVIGETGLDRVAITRDLSGTP